MPVPDPPSDVLLVHRAKAGEYDAFELLVGRHERRLFALAQGILRSREDAQDAVQKGLLAAVEHLKDFREEASFGTWVTRIVTNQSLELLRSRKLRAAVPYDESGADGDEPGLPPPRVIARWKDTPEELATRAETARVIGEALEALDEKHRTVFLLRDVEGRSVAETARALGLSEVNVKVRLMRARLKLREHLTRVFGDPARNLSADHPSGSVGGHHS
jgi:RNA polymerase sigma-70 factor (ECF subfamily)